jgi:hypothetical protein
MTDETVPEEESENGGSGPAETSDDSESVESEDTGEDGAAPDMNLDFEIPAPDMPAVEEPAEETDSE